jgi:transposase
MGYTLKMIAVFIDQSYSAVAQGARRHKVEVQEAFVVRKHPPELIQTLRDRGHSYQAIADLLGCSKSGVRAYSQRSGLIPLNDSPGEVERIKALQAQGLTHLEIAKRTHRSRDFIVVALRQ